MSATSASGSRSEPENDGGARATSIVHEIARTASGGTGLVGLATSSALPAALISAIFTAWYLKASQFGEYGILMVYATALTVLYNVGLLHGTFLWVYGTSGEAGDDLEIEGLGRAGVNTQRRAMTTGLVMLLIMATAGTTFFFIFKREVAVLLLGNAHAANLVGWAAISGAGGSLYRLTCNVLRFERRQRAFALASVMRPFTVVGASFAFLAAGYGLWGAVMGTAVPTVVCAVGCMVATRRSYAFSASLKDAKEIAVRGLTVVIPVCALFILHNGDILVVSQFLHGARAAAAIGVYRLASRFGTPPSYFASAFIMTWSPLERSALGNAAFKSQGRLELRAGVAYYFFLVGLAMVVLSVLLAHVGMLVLPYSYRKAADIVPVMALAYVFYGGYIVLLRTARPDRLIMWYTLTAVLAAIVFLLSAAVLIPALGVIGTPLALMIGMIAGCAVLLVVNERNHARTPFPYGRITIAFLVSGAVSGLSLAAGTIGGWTAAFTNLFCLIAYVPALIFSGAIPRSHLTAIREVMFKRTRHSRLQMTPDDLAPAERDALERFTAGTMQDSRNAVDYARLVRALRRLGGIGTPSSSDVRIGLYLSSREAEAIRDWQAIALMEEGVDSYELHCLDQLAKKARRNKLVAKRRRRLLPRRVLRERARELPAAERARVAGLLSAAGVPTGGKRRERLLLGPGGDGNGGNGVNGHSHSLALVRAVRSVRRSLNIGDASPSDLTLARALWQGESGELGELDRGELRRLRAAAKLSSGFVDELAVDEIAVETTELEAVT